MFLRVSFVEIKCRTYLTTIIVVSPFLPVGEAWEILACAESIGVSRSFTVSSFLLVGDYVLLSLRQEVRREVSRPPTTIKRLFSLA